MKFIDKIGFFRLTLIPLAIVIIITAIVNHIWGMGIVGAIILIYGILNKCLITGQCEVEDKSEHKIKSKE